MGEQYLGLGMDSTAVLCIVIVNDIVNESCIYCGYCEVDVKRLCVRLMFWLFTNNYSKQVIYLY